MNIVKKTASALIKVLLLVCMSGCAESNDPYMYHISIVTDDDTEKTITANIEQAQEDIVGNTDGHILSALTNVTEIQTPVAVLVGWKSEDGEKNYSVLESEKLNAVKDISKAKSFLYIEEKICRANSSSTEEYYAAYDIYAASSDYRIIAALTPSDSSKSVYFKSDTEKDRTKISSGKTHRKILEKYIEQLLDTFEFSKNASDDVTLVMDFYAGYLDIDRDMLYSAVENGEYSQDKQLSSSKSLLPLPYGFRLLDSGCVPKAEKNEDFRRDNAMQWKNSLKSAFCNITEIEQIDAAAMADAIRNGLPHIFGIEEYTALNYLASYVGIGKVYTYDTLFSFVNADSGELIAWKRCSNSREAFGSVRENQVYTNIYGEKIFGMYNPDWGSVWKYIVQ